MKRLIAALTGVLMLLPFAKTIKADAMSFPIKETLHSESAILINLDTDAVVHEKNADVQQMPGPLVNIMTAIVCLENCDNLEEKITMDEDIYWHVFQTDYIDDVRTAEIYDGDVLTVTDLLYAMMLTSSIEASETLAYHFGDGSVNTFVEMMNAKAQEIGCTSTNFVNPTGMYDTNQYSTARDIAVMTQYALDNVPLFETIATTKDYNPSVPNLENHPTHTDWVWHHSNTMMDPDNDNYYPAAKGIKTANLQAAGRNIVALASKDGNNYLTVLLKSPIQNADGDVTYYHLEDAVQIFDWAFEHFSYQVILSETAEIGELPVELADGNDYVLARPKEEFSILWYDEVDTSLIKKDDIVWDKEKLQAPIEKGQRLGEVTLTYSGEKLGTVELVAVSAVERSTAKYNLFAAKMYYKSKWFSKAFVISCILCLIYILICIYAYICFKNKSKPVKPIYAVPKVEKSRKKRNNNNNEQ